MQVGGFDESFAPRRRGAGPLDRVTDEPQETHADGGVGDEGSKVTGDQENEIPPCKNGVGCLEKAQLVDESINAPRQRDHCADKDDQTEDSDNFGFITFISAHECKGIFHSEITNEDWEFTGKKVSSDLPDISVKRCRALYAQEPSGGKGHKNYWEWDLNSW